MPKGAVVPLKLQFTDAGHEKLTTLPPLEYCTSMPVTHYLPPHRSGGSSEMRAYSTQQGSSFTIDELTCNVAQPLDVSWLRLLCVAFVVMAVALLPVALGEARDAGRIQISSGRPPLLGVVLVRLAEFAPGAYVDVAHSYPALYHFVKYLLFGLLL